MSGDWQLLSRSRREVW